jgi:hypothetical protein
MTQNADSGRVIRYRLDLTQDDLGWLELAIADYIAKWGEHWTGVPYMGEFGPSLAGLPTAMANMAMTVIRKRLVDAPSPNDSFGTP